MSSQREGYTCGFVFVNFEAPFLEPLFIESRPRWRVEDAIMGSAWDANSAVSSANVAMVISYNIGKSAV